MARFEEREVDIQMGEEAGVDYILAHVLMHPDPAHDAREHLKDRERLIHKRKCEKRRIDPDSCQICKYQGKLQISMPDEFASLEQALNDVILSCTLSRRATEHLTSLWQAIVARGRRLQRSVPRIHICIYCVYDHYHNCVLHELFAIRDLYDETAASRRAMSGRLLTSMSEQGGRANANLDLKTGELHLKCVKEERYLLESLDKMKRNVLSKISTRGSNGLAPVRTELPDVRADMQKSNVNALARYSRRLRQRPEVSDPA